MVIQSDISWGYTLWQTIGVCELKAELSSNSSMIYRTPNGRGFPSSQTPMVWFKGTF